MMNRFAIALCALLLAACSDNETQAGADAAPSDDAGSSTDAPHDSSADTWQEPTPDAGHPLYRTCTPGTAGECPDIPFDGSSLKAILVLDGGEQTGGCIDFHRTVGDRDLYGTCAYACLEPQVDHMPAWRACRAIGGHCVRWTPDGIAYDAPGAIACLPDDTP